MTFPFDVIDWLFGLGSSAASGVGNWLSSIGGSIASGLEGGFISILKDLWDTIRPFLFITLGAIIMLSAAAWLFYGSIKPSDLVALVAAVAK